VADPFDLTELLGEFREEAASQLDRLDAALIDLERDGDVEDDTADALLRALHTLKGNAGMLGLAPVRDLVHRLEAVFKTPPSRWEQSHLDRLFEAAQRLRAAVERAGGAEQDDAFARLADVHVAADVPSAPSAGATRPQRSRGSGPARADADTDADEEPASPAASRPAARSDSADRIRVPFGRLDELLNQAGELGALALAFDAFLRDNKPLLRRHGLWAALTMHGERLGRLGYELRERVMDIRLVPVSTAFSRFPRVARDLARDQGKRVEVELEGESTELDKSTVDALADPLLHLVRNAIDHGLETPEQREAAGKPPAGRLRLSAEQQGERVRVIVEDDGRGLDREAILRRARERGLVDAADDVEPARLIFRQGFSTRENESLVSGRGVGLDVVRRQVQELRGDVRVEDVAGGGTRFVLELPLTVAVTSAVLFESAGEVLALPAAAVEETIRADGVEPLGRSEVVHYRGESVPVARPERLFGWDGQGGAAAGADYALVVHRGGRRIAVAAQRLVDQRDLMVKRLPPFLGPTRGVTGVTITPDGRAVLLLDPEALLDLGLRVQRQRG